jgi:hypothetical protein
MDALRDTGGDVRDVKTARPKSAHVTSTNRRKFQKSQMLIRSLFFMIIGSLFPSCSCAYSNYALFLFKMVVLHNYISC